jgi:hypothetical protein
MAVRRLAAAPRLHHAQRRAAQRPSQQRIHRSRRAPLLLRRLRAYEVMSVMNACQSVNACVP